MSSLGKVVASIAKLAFQTVNDDLIRDLQRDSQILDRIRDSFSRILDRRTFTVWSFVEELATAGVGKVYIT
jgi:protein SERAC1